jgi:1-phosphofructokinase
VEFDVVTVTVNPAIDQTVWIPGFRAGAVNRVRREQSSPGGGGINVAADLARFGVAVLATGLLGAQNATSFEALLADEGIADAFVRTAGITRTDVMIADDVAGVTTDINFPGFTVAADELVALTATITAAVVPGRWVVLTGSLPVGAAAATYRDLVDAVHARGGLVALDTSGAALAEALRATPELVKPNRAELEELVGGALPDCDDVVAAARMLVATGVGTVVVSLGAEGAVFVRAEEAVFAAPLPVHVATTVGAGDAMMAGTVAGLLQGLRLADVAALATAFSAATITRVGAHVDPAAVRRTVTDVDVERLPAPVPVRL